MKIIEMPVMLSDEEYQIFMTKFKTDIALRGHLHRVISDSVMASVQETICDISWMTEEEKAGA